ncbi:hypothetical protein Dsin_032392 [Dipteronia sinensis]|uniref:Uncharacterized protein n=1 Tax=Dipteronia sinensis TaxID=43782 RepID=A0AAD9ZMW6_9ROSI|nr:hypothetical protein Dsin_032392 [Dipteronia sinensis]
MMDVQITCKKLIKPYVPTPTHLQNMRLSFMDQYTYPTTVPVIFYYPSATINHHPAQTVVRHNQLEKSLSEILTLYYPLAGRYIKEKLIVDCNDEGIEYVEASVDGQLSQILRGVEAKELNQFVPDEVEESATSPLLAIQVSVFNCGGLAIGLRFSHRIMDAFTLFLFVNGWAKTCKVGIVNGVISPNFDSGILFPTRDHVSEQKVPTSSKTRPKVVTKRFVFDAKAILKLKADQALSCCGQFSVVELMIALIWMAQIDAARARNGRLRTSLLLVPMNLRGKTFEKIPENCCGNLFTLITGRFPADDESKIMGLNDFINLVKGTIRKSMVEYAKPMKDEDEFFTKVISIPGREIIEEFTKGNGDRRPFTSWRNLDMYDVDFGLGKPAWVSVAERPYSGVFLMDRKGGDGIEAWVTMDEQEMPFFQQDSHIANFSST